MSEEKKALVEMTLVRAENLADLTAFVELVHSLGFPSSSPVAMDNYPTRITVRHFLDRMPAPMRRRDPETGRFVRAAS